MGYEIDDISILQPWTESRTSENPYSVNIKCWVDNILKLSIRDFFLMYFLPYAPLTLYNNEQVI